MAMVPPAATTVCVTKVTVVTAVVACSAFWSAAASVSEGKVICPTIVGACTPAETAVSALDDNLKPPVVSACAAPSVSPVIVIATAEVPVEAPPIVRTIEVLVAVAAVDEVAVKDVTLLAMEVTVPKK